MLYVIGHHEIGQFVVLTFDQNRFQKLEVLIAEKETELKEMNAEIAATGTDDRAKMTELSYKYETIQNELSSAMEEWTQLGEKLI